MQQEIAGDKAPRSEQVNVIYWLRGESRQNFGDYLSEYLLQGALLGPRVSACAYRIVGSALLDWNMQQDVAQHCSEPEDKVAYWCCGMRQDDDIPSEDTLAHCLIMGVRGPLTRQALGLGPETAVGDTGLLLPLFHQVRPRSSTSGKTVCVPHFHEKKSDDELLKLSKADVVVRPNIENSIQALQTVIDEIASSSFVLCGSLHAAVVACAYNVPFAFWETGYLDLPFKWRDFAASINCTAQFVADVPTGQRVYSEFTAPVLRKPRLLPILAYCPFYVRPEVIVRAMVADGLISPEEGEAALSAMAQAGFQSDTYSENMSERLIAFVKGRDAFKQERDAFQAKLQVLRTEIADLEVSGRTGEWTIGTLRQAILRQEAQILDLQEAIDLMVNSRSWRYTEWFRTALTQVANRKRQLRIVLKAFTPGGGAERRRVASAVLRRLPISEKNRFRLRWLVLKLFSPLLPSEKERAAKARGTESGTGEKWILMVEWRIPMPESNSGSFKMFHMMNIFLERGFKVFFISDHGLDQYHWVVKDRSELRPYESRLHELGVEYVFGRDAAIEHLKTMGWRYRYAMLFFPDVANDYIPLVRAFCPDARIIFDSGDLHFLRFEREAEVRKDPRLFDTAEQYKKIESLVIRNSDVTVAISDEEKSIIESLVPGAKVEVQQNIYEVGKNEVRPSFEARKDLIFVGHYLHRPNADAALYFVKEIFPLIRKEIPDIEFLIVGSNPTGEITSINEPGVRVVGFVEDIGAVIDQCRIMVVPLRYGAGVKGKVGQSMSLGLPVVTTSIGAEGMGLEDGKTALIADDPAEFAKAVVKLYNDAGLWKSLSENAQGHIDRIMGYQKAFEQMGKVLARADEDEG